MELAGKLLSRRGNVVTIELEDADKLYLLDKYDPAQTGQVGLYIADKRRVSPQQRKFAWALINDIANSNVGAGWAGDSHLVRRHLDLVYCYYYGVDSFSLSDRYGVKSQVNEYINMLLQFCLDHNVGLSFLPIKELAPEEVSKWEYACLMNKCCVICGKKAELAHVKAIGYVNSRKKMNHKGLLVMAVCHFHHQQQHSSAWGIDRFMSEYHLSGIVVNREIAKLYNLNYFD